MRAIIKARRDEEEDISGWEEKRERVGILSIILRESYGHQQHEGFNLWPYKRKYVCDGIMVGGLCIGKM